MEGSEKMSTCQCDKAPWTFDDASKTWHRNSQTWLPPNPGSYKDVMHCDRCGDMLFDSGMVVPVASLWEYEEMADRVQVQEKVIDILALRLTTNAIERDSIIQAAYDKALNQVRNTETEDPLHKPLNVEITAFGDWGEPGVKAALEAAFVEELHRCGFCRRPPVPEPDICEPESTCPTQKKKNWLQRLLTQRNKQSKG